MVMAAYIAVLLGGTLLGVLGTFLYYAIAGKLNKAKEKMGVTKRDAATGEIIKEPTDEELDELRNEL